MTRQSTRFSEDQFQNGWKNLGADQKAGYLVWPSLAGHEVSKSEAELLERFAPWGVSLFARNLKSLAAGRSLCATIRRITQKHRHADLPSGFIAIDEEGGRVSRLPRPFPRLDPAASFANKPDFELESQSILQGGVAKSLGINMIFAPVCDLLLDPNNQVIGDRSFGSTPGQVYAKAKVVYDALLSCGICPVLKHFPGHGGTKEDTHIGSARENRKIEDLLQNELAVFRSFISSHNMGEPFSLMTCHVVFEAIDTVWPATLSKLTLEELLRKTMGFSGLVMSDDLRMNAIANCYNVQKKQEVAIGSDELSRLESENVQGASAAGDAYLIQAVFRALESGCDVVLACRGIEREAPLLEAVSERLQRDKVFDEVACAKAWRVHVLAEQTSKL